MTLWKVGDTADYSLFNTCRKLHYYVNNGFNLNEDMILKTSYLDLWLTRNYLFAQYGYTFELSQDVLYVFSEEELIDAYEDLCEMYQKAQDSNLGLMMTF